MREGVSKGACPAAFQATRKSKAVAAISRTNPAFSGFPRVALSKYVPPLLDAGMTVALCMQVTPPPNPQRRVTEVLSRATASSSALLDPGPGSDCFSQQGGGGGGGGGASSCLMAVVLERGRDWSAEIGRAHV